MRSELKSRDIKVNLSTDSYIFFHSLVFHMYYGQSFFHLCHSLGSEDISLFFLDLLLSSDEDVCKGEFYGVFFLSSLLSCYAVETYAHALTFTSIFFLHGAKLCRSDCSMQSNPL